MTNAQPQIGLSQESFALVKDALSATASSKAKDKKEDTSVVREGKRMILPERMTWDEGIAVLTRKKKEAETLVDVREEIQAFPLDGAYALRMVLNEMFGWSDAVPKVVQTFFGKKEIAPDLLSLEVGYGEFVQVVWGCFAVPGINGVLETQAGFRFGKPVFVIAGQVTLQHKPIIEEIANAVRRYLKTKSVYRGKAVKIQTDGSGELDLRTAPGFLDLSRVNPDELVYPDDVAEQVQTSLWTPIEKTEMCRTHGVPLKRGVLFEGPYGTGKTLAAFVTAKKCEENGWTFIYLDRVAGLKAAITFAQQYAPAVIFAEDIDRVVQGERSVKIDDILNQIDGIDSKGSEIITILTTNYVDNIEKAMLRPGRLDAVISVTAPDAKAAEKLVRIYARGLLTAGEDLTEAGKELAGSIPATIREVVERSKLHAIGRAKGNEPMALKGSDLVHAARGMKRHAELMKPKETGKITAEESVGRGLVELSAKAVNGKIEARFASVEATLEKIAEAVS